MLLKDYYSILKIPASAGTDEIKRAYRQLALQFHPDKNPGDAYAAAQFLEAKEAYEVLTDPAKKAYYLQQRWYQQSTGSRKTQQTITPVNILKQVIELERYVSKLDHFRMDKQGLYDYITDISNPETISGLNAFHDTTANEKIISTLLLCVKPLPYPLVAKICQQLKKLEMTEAMQQDIDQFMLTHKNAAKRDSYQVWIILAIVAALCALIFFAGRF